MENCNLPAFADSDVRDAVASCVRDLLTKVASQSQEKEENPGNTGVAVNSTNGAGSGEAGEEAVVGKEKQIDETSVARKVENDEGEEGPLMEKSTSEDVDGKSREDRMDMEKADDGVVFEQSGGAMVDSSSRTPRRNESANVDVPMIDSSIASDSNGEARLPAVENIDYDDSSDDNSRRLNMNDGNQAIENMDTGVSKNGTASGRSDSSGTIDYDSSSDDNSRRSNVNGGNPQQNGAISNMDGVVVVENGGRDEGGRESDSKDASSVSNSSKSNTGEGSSPSEEREESMMRSRTESTPSDRTAGDPDAGYIFGSGGSDYENSSDEFDANEPSTSAAHQEPVARSGEDGGRRNVVRVEEESDDSEVMAQLIALQNQRLEREAEFRLLETPYHESPCRRLSFGSSSSDEAVNLQNVGANGAVAEGSGMATNGNEEIENVVGVRSPVRRMAVRRVKSDSHLSRMERRNEGVSPRKVRSLKRSSISDDFEAELERKRRRVPEVVPAMVNLDRDEAEMPDIDGMDAVDGMEIDDDNGDEAADDAVGDGNDDDDAVSEATSIHTAIELRRSTRIRNPIQRWGYDHVIPKRRGPRRGGVQKRRKSRKPRRRVPQLPTPPPPPPVPRPAPFVSRMLPVLPPAPAPVPVVFGNVGGLDEIAEEVEEIEDLLIQYDYESRQLEILLMLRRLQGQVKKFESTAPNDEQKKRMWNAVARIKAMMGSN